MADVAVEANVETVTVVATVVVVTGAKPMVTVTVVATEAVVAAVAVVASSTSCELSFLWHYLHSYLFVVLSNVVKFRVESSVLPTKELTLLPKGGRQP